MKDLVKLQDILFSYSDEIEILLLQAEKVYREKYPWLIPLVGQGDILEALLLNSCYIASYAFDSEIGKRIFLAIKTDDIEGWPK